MNTENKAAMDVTEEASERNSLFLGDQGELPLETRRTLIQLLRGPYLDIRRHSLLWPILKRDETLIRHRLGDLFLELIIDENMGVAFIRKADTEDLEVSSLLRRAQLTFIDSVLLLYLRQCLLEADIKNERAVVEMANIHSYLMLYEKSYSTDQAGFQKRISASFEKLKKYNILQKIRGSDARFEISPTLKLLFSVEEIQSLTAIYKEKAAGEDSYE